MPRHIIEGDSIDKHGDVNTSGASEGDALVWDNTAGEWVPGEVAGGGSGTPDPHAESHEQSGSDELSLDASQISTGQFVDARISESSVTQHAPSQNDFDNHSSRHEQGGADALEASSLGTSENDTDLVLKPDGEGGVVWGAGSSGNGGDVSALTLPDIETYQRFIICAHRGDINPTDGFPEGTLEGYRQAAIKGVHRVDLDLRQSSEGTWHIMHDSTVTRTTDGSGSISGMTDAQIAALTIDGGAGYDSGRHDVMELKVPTLDAVIEALWPYDITFQMDNKLGASGATVIAQYVVDNGIAHRVAINAYSSGAYDNIKAVSERIEVINNGGEWHTPVYTDVDSEEYVTSRAPRKVMGVVSGTTFGDESTIVRNLYERGARGITSNNIESAIAELRTIEAEVAGLTSLGSLNDVDVSGRVNGDVLTWDSGESAWVAEAPQLGNGSLASIRGTAAIEDPDTDVDVEHNAPQEPQRGEIQVTPASALFDASQFWVSNIGAETFRINLDTAPGNSETVEFDWLYQPANEAQTFTIEAFTENDTWDWEAAGEPETVEVLVVAGGGGGGARYGGGGGGGVRYDPEFPVTENLAVIIGAGGNGAQTNGRGDSGGNSSFGAMEAIGGGGGGGGEASSTPPVQDGRDGGSGGGAGAGGDSGSGGAGTVGQGHDGGDDSPGGGSGTAAGGGGGGAGEAGQDGQNGDPGDGGNGLHFSQFSAYGQSGWFGGGGGAGGALTSGVGIGGQGGGEDGSNNLTRPSDATANTGGGGGGGGWNSGTGPASHGGSGIVLVRYPTPSS